MAYHDPVYETYTLPTADMTSASTLLNVAGPEGHKGVLVSVGAVITTDVTGSSSTIQIGDSGDATKFGSLSVPVATSGNLYNSPTINDVDSNLMPADTIVEIACDGGATAGQADTKVTIAWFKG